MSVTFKPITLEEDEDYNDTFKDVSITEKRIIRVSEKTFQSTGKYFFLKIFRKNAISMIWERSQYIGLTDAEMTALLEAFVKDDDYTHDTTPAPPPPCSTPEAPRKRKIARTNIAPEQRRNIFSIFGGKEEPSSSSSTVETNSLESVTGELMIKEEPSSPELFSPDSQSSNHHISRRVQIFSLDDDDNEEDNQFDASQQQPVFPSAQYNKRWL